MKLAQKIKILAEQDPFEAEMLADRGKTFSPIEQALSQYYHGLAMLSEPIYLERLHLLFSKVGSTMSLTELRAGYEATHARTKDEICDYVLSAIDSRDGAKLKEFAMAVSYLKEERQGDAIRAKLLCYRQIFEGRKLKPSPAQLAKLCQYSGSMRNFSRILDDLKVPHRKSLGGRPRKPRQMPNKKSR